MYPIRHYFFIFLHSGNPQCNFKIYIYYLLILFQFPKVDCLPSTTHHLVADIDYVIEQLKETVAPVPKIGYNRFINTLVFGCLRNTRCLGRIGECFVFFVQHLNTSTLENYVDLQLMIFVIW